MEYLFFAKIPAPLVPPIPPHQSGNKGLSAGKCMSLAAAVTVVRGIGRRVRKPTPD